MEVIRCKDCGSLEKVNDLDGINWESFYCIMCCRYTEFEVNDPKVIELGATKPKKDKSEQSFDDIIAKNKAKADKLAKERAKHNKGVTRSYRLKR